MQPIIFDFEKIGNLKDFYAVAYKELALPAHFGNNLDALWDCITGEITLPATVEFKNLSMGQLETFGAILDLFTEAAEQNPELSFVYSLKK